MGTRFTVYLYDTEAEREHEVFQAVFEEIERIEKTFSRFLASSEIVRINDEASQGPVVTDPEVFNLLVFAKELSEKTEGAFDITIGRLSRAWGFAERRPAIPSPDTLRAAEAAVGWRHLNLDVNWRTVEFLESGMELDLGAIAKGYAVDRALDLLRTLGIEAMIDAGSSSIAANGEYFSQRWPIGVADPVRVGESLGEVFLGNRALSTSGIREQSFTADGRVYSHLLNPISPLSHRSAEDSEAPQVMQTSILAPDSALADGLSTAMFILGPRRGEAVMEQFPACSVLWILSGCAGLSCSGIRWPATQQIIEER